MPDGYVYVLINTEYDGFVKVGKTTRPPVERAEELSRSSGVVGSFEVFFEARCIDIDHVEYLVHQALRKHRRQKNREFFNVSPERAAQTVKKCILLLEEDEYESENSQFENPLFSDEALLEYGRELRRQVSTNMGPEPANSHLGTMPWPKITNVTPLGFHTRNVRKPCPKCGGIFSQTLARGETIVRSPCCFAALDTKTSW